MSTLEALARSATGRALLRNAIAPNSPSRTYKVTLIDPRSVKPLAKPQAKTVDVDAWFPLENGEFVYALKGWKAPTKEHPSEIPLWPAIIESAYALILSASGPADHQAAPNYQAIEHGSIASGDNPLNAFTGAARRVHRTTDWERFTVQGPEKIKQALAAGWPVTAGTGKHQYSLVEANDKGVKIRDPNRVENGAFPQADPKWTPDDSPGSFTITWEQFKAHFLDYVTISQDRGADW